MPEDVDVITLEELEADPVPVLARLRRDAPVAFVPALDMWLVTRWDDVVFVDEHPELFTAATEPSFLARTLGANMLTSDPPVHTRLREIMLPPFQPGGRSGGFVAEELAGLADQLLDRLDPSSPFDVMEAYAQPLSAGSLAIVLGLDHHGFDTMWRWCRGVCADIANFGDDPELTAIGERAKVELGIAIDERIAAARRDGDADDSAISWFVTHGASHEEIVNNVRLMISGGINEPRDGIGLVAWVLLTRPDLRATVVAEPGRLRRLVEEVFRVHSPVGTITRQATCDVQLGGVTIPEGALVAGVLRSINLDESHWDAPAEIRLDRREGTHAAFALGPHRCLGEWLGRQEVRVGVERLLARFPGLVLDPAHAVELTGFEFRGPKALWVDPDGGGQHGGGQHGGGG
ncbi:MAG TPA: cytochrome P450 [Ilumatobacter sp.]|nr:cytochrome P450 [Ilumatobacter sp.]